MIADQDKTKEQLIAELAELHRSADAARHADQGLQESERKAAEAELAKYRQHLEDMVTARTAELTLLNAQLRQEIEEHKKTEDALRRSEEQFRTVVETSSDAIITVDDRGEIVLWNKGAEKIYGYTAEEVLNTPFFKMVPDSIRESHAEKFSALLSTGKPGVIVTKTELRGRRKDGSEFPTEGSASLSKNRNGVFITTMIRDITERKIAEQSLLATREFYATILESIVNGVWVTDRYDCLTYINKGMETIAGIPREQWPRGNIFERFKEETIRFIAPYYLKARNTLQPVWYDSVPIVTLSGRHTIQTGWLMPMVKDGAFDGMICTVEDLTEQKQVEDALRRSEEQFRSVIETASDAIVTADSSGNIILWNKSAEAMFGYTAQEILNQPFASIVTKEKRETHLRHFNNFIAERKPGIIVSQGELHGLRKDGSSFPTEGSASLWETSDGVFITSLIRNISERKQSEELLKESEERFRKLAQTALDAIFLADENRHIIFWNKAAERIFGYTEQEALGKISTFVVPEELRELDEAGFQQLIATGCSPVLDRYFEAQGLRKDGTVFPTEVSFSNWKSRGKSFYCGVTRDITERKIAEASLRESENKFRNMTARISAAIFIYQQTKLVYANSAAAKITGYSPEELLGMRFWNVMHPDFKEQAEEWDRMQRTGERLPPHFEIKIVTKNGNARWVDYSAALIDYNGREAVLGTALDITERKLAEEALRQSEEQYRLTAENVPFHIGAVDQSYKYVLWNRHSEKMFGYTAEEVIDKISPSAVHASKKEAKAVVAAAIDKGVFDGELNLRRKDGSRFPAHLVVVPDKDQRGNVLGLYGFAEDITLRKRDEDLIKKVNDCLLSFSADPDENIQRIIEAAGILFDGSSASYHKKQGDFLHIAAAWKLPAKLLNSPPISAHHFNQLFSSCKDGPVIVSASDALPFLRKNSPMLQMGFESFIATPIKVRGTLIGSLNVAFREAKTFSPNELNIFSILTKAVSIEEQRKNVLDDLTLHQQKLKQSEKRLKAFSCRILSIREEEKKNISSTLHDELGSMVVALSSGLAIAKEEILENSLEPAFKSIERTEAALKHAVETLKKITIDMRPPNLEIVGLSNALGSYLSTVARQTKVVIDYSADIEDHAIDENTAITLYRIAQEAINNVLKHARAQNITVRLHRVKNKITLSITDDGRGFDIASLTTIGRGATRIGIQGIQERVAALGGIFSLQSEPQKGTALHITIPAKRGRQK
jgi:PAS domain S-box-containing protein